ncbi:hypothetical protein CVT26_010832 [Gymnopilus dilepis]|uniref:Uncharacterized protein n=1 Tax=Gymnopilus dilepis TaxID=231916 RepID=A0A409VXZ3_9AGAR|nr:hypothetical protein CVT26_010832 [Gymnopilus dilepis]
MRPLCLRSAIRPKRWRGRDKAFTILAKFGHLGRALSFTDNLGQCEVWRGNPLTKFGVVYNDDNAAPRLSGFADALQAQLQVDFSTDLSAGVHLTRFQGRMLQLGMRSVSSTPPLNEDVLEEIFSIVCDVSYPTLQSLLCTSRLFNTLTRPFLYRYIGVNVADDSFMDEISTWFADTENTAPVLKYIHHIALFYHDRFYDKQQRPSRPLKVIGHVHSKRKSEDGYSNQIRGSAKQRDGEAEWAALAKLISNTTQLRSVTFACQIAMPLVLIQSIRNYPSLVHLDIVSWTRSSSALSHDDPAELELLGLPSLRSIQAHFYDPECRPNDLRLPALRRLLLSAPNLHTVNVQTSRIGCVVRGYNPSEYQEWENLAAHFERTTIPHTETRRALENLKISGLDVLDLSVKNLSGIVNLDCHVMSVEIAHLLTSLTHLTLRDRSRTGQLINEVLAVLPPLMSLKVVGWSTSLQLETVFIHHGTSLRALALHELERIDPSNHRPVLSTTDILQIHERCPHLEQLSIDLNFPEDPLPESDTLNIDVHQEIYDAISNFAYLRRLHLNYNLGISTYSRQRFDQPHKALGRVDEAFARRLWLAGYWSSLT